MRLAIETCQHDGILGVKSRKFLFSPFRAVKLSRPLQRTLPVAIDIGPVQGLLLSLS